jgi:hypothetical protein
MKLITLAASSAVLALVSCATTARQTTGTPGEVAFRSTVRPLFEHRCIHCHNDKKPLAGLNLQDRDGSLDPARRFIIPGDPQNSRIYRAVMQENAHPKVMPADGWGITKIQEDALKKWISEGAPWPEGRAGQLRKKTYRIERGDYL